MSSYENWQHSVGSCTGSSKSLWKGYIAFVAHLSQVCKHSYFEFLQDDFVYCIAKASDSESEFNALFVIILSEGSSLKDPIEISL